MYEIYKAGRWGCILPIPQGKLKIMLNKKMSYRKLGAEFMPNPAWGIVQLYKDKKGWFPWGFRKLVIEIFEAWEKYSGESFKIEFNPGNISQLSFIDNELREYQRAAIKAIIENQGGIISIPTGGGKSRCALEIIRQMNVPTAIIVHTIDLKSQWLNVCMGLPNIEVKTFQSIRNHQDLDKFQLVVFDECHRVAAKSIFKVAMASRNAMCIGLSATPYREDGHEMKIEAALGRIVYVISRKELIDNGYLVPAKVYYHSISDSGYDFWENYQEAYRTYIVENEERNNKIVELIKKEYGDFKRILVLFSQIEHMDIIKDKVKEIIPVEDLIYVNGQMSRKMRAINVLKMHHSNKYVALSSPVFDEGIDIPNCNVLILAAGGKSSIKITQRIGRILRIDANKFTATMHDFVDSCQWLTEHYEKRREILTQDFEVIDV